MTTNLRPLRRRAMVGDDVYDALRSALLSNRISPGTAIRLDDLARELGVSSTPIREALGRLVVDGLVVKQANRGWTASALLDTASILDLYDARRIVEPELARRATERATAAELEALAQLAIVPDLSQVDETSRIGVWISSDERLHAYIAGLGGNVAIAEFLARINVRMRTYRAFYGRDDAARRAHAEHQEIVAAIVAGRADVAAAAMAAHLGLASDRMVHAFR